MRLWAICEAGVQGNFNAICEQRGWGPNNFSVPLTPDGETVTHYGLSANMGAENAIWLSDVVAANPAAAASLHTMFHEVSPEGSFWDWAEGLGLRATAHDES